MRLLKIVLMLTIVIVALLFAWNNLFISEENRSEAPFNSIDASGPINVFIKQAEQESIIIRSDSNLLDNLITEVINGELKIYSEGRIQHERVLDVYINYKKLDSIHASGASTITGRSILTTGKLKIKSSAASEIKLQVKVDSLNLIMNDNANVQLAGTATNFDLLITHVGDLMAYNLVSQYCKATVSTGDQSPGIARINVEKILNVIIKGPRHIKYKGDAKVVNQMIDGQGKVIKI